jgi:hypothetical protein
VHPRRVRHNGSVESLSNYDALHDHSTLSQDHVSMYVTQPNFKILLKINKFEIVGYVTKTHSMHTHTRLMDLLFQS